MTQFQQNQTRRRVAMPSVFAIIVISWNKGQFYIITLMQKGSAFRSWVCIHRTNDAPNPRIFFCLDIHSIHTRSKHTNISFIQVYTQCNNDEEEDPRCFRKLSFPISQSHVGGNYTYPDTIDISKSVAAESKRCFTGSKFGDILKKYVAKAFCCHFYVLRVKLILRDEVGWVVDDRTRYASLKTALANGHSKNLIVTVYIACIIGLNCQYHRFGTLKVCYLQRRGRWIRGNPVVDTKNVSWHPRYNIFEREITTFPDTPDPHWSNGGRNWQVTTHLASSKFWSLPLHSSMNQHTMPRRRFRSDFVVLRGCRAICENKHDTGYLHDDGALSVQVFWGFEHEL